jgi:predicted transcriptional regulator
MAKLYGFPTHKTIKLPKEVEHCLQAIADGYVQVMHYAMEQMCGDNPTEEELKVAQDLILMAYAKGLNEAIEKL